VPSSSQSIRSRIAAACGAFVKHNSDIVSVKADFL
jgi:hypothetical protein